MKISCRASRQRAVIRATGVVLVLLAVLVVEAGQAPTTQPAAQHRTATFRSRGQSVHHVHGQQQAPITSGNSHKQHRLQLLSSSDKRLPMLHSSSSSSSSSGDLQLAGRSLQQSVAAAYSPPKFYIDQASVQAQLVNTYTWKLTRRTTAQSISVLADGRSRSQLGYELLYTKQLEQREYVVQGSTVITNVMSTPLTVMSVSVFVGTKEVKPQCKTMPGSNYVMSPSETVTCNFKISLANDPGQASLVSFVQTTLSRKQADAAIPVSFAACTGSGGSGCTVQDIGGCVYVTDGSRIVKRYADNRGTAVAGQVDMTSQLFDVPVIVPSRQGAPQLEAQIPVPPPAVDVAPTSSNAGIATADMPNDSWWARRRRRSLLASGMTYRLMTNQWMTNGLSGIGEAMTLHHPWQQQQQQQLLRRRALRQASLPASTVKSLANSESFKWPYPQITGNRPPMGEDGKPLKEAPKKICETTPFSYSMIFGPVLPVTCGIFEVTSTAAAAYVDNSKPVERLGTYTYLQVLCPKPATEKAALNAAPAPGAAGFLSLEQAYAADRRPAGPRSKATATPILSTAASFQSMDQSGGDSSGSGSSSTSSPGDVSAGTSSPAPSPSPATNAGSSNSTTTTSSSNPAGSTTPAVVTSPSPLRVVVLEAQSVLLTSYSWSLSSAPIAQTNNNVTGVGCWLKAERSPGVTGQVITGTVRLGNPLTVTDPQAAIINIISVTVTAVVASGAWGKKEPVTAVADCRGANDKGEQQLMPWRRTNCTFELRVSASGEDEPLMPLVGNVMATATVEANRAAGTTQDVTSEPFPFSFEPSALTAAPSSNDTAANSSGSSAPPPMRQVAIGSCAQLSSGIIIAEDLPANTSALAAAVAAAGPNGTSQDGSGARCVKVCGAQEPVKEVTVYAPVTGYSKEQCGTHQLYCVGAIIPDNDAWKGQGMLEPALVTTSSSIKVWGACSAKSAQGNSGSSGAPSSSGDSSSSSATNTPSSSGPPVQLILQDVSGQRVTRYSWSSKLTLETAPATAAPTATTTATDNTTNGGINMPASSGAALTLLAKHTKRSTPPTGRISGQLQLQQNPASFSKADSVKDVGVYILLPCGTSLEANLTGACAGGGDVKLPATCSYQLDEISLDNAAAVVVMANATATVLLPDSKAAPSPPPASISPPPPPSAGGGTGSGAAAGGDGTAAGDAGTPADGDGGTSGEAPADEAPTPGSDAGTGTAGDYPEGDAGAAAAGNGRSSGRKLAQAAANNGTAADDGNSAPPGTNGTGATGNGANATGANSTAAGNGTAAGNSTANSTSVVALPPSVVITVQSAPVTYVLATAPEVAIDLCVNLTSNFKLTLTGGISPSSSGISSSGDSSSGNSTGQQDGEVSQPIVEPTTLLPDALCSSSEIRYNLRLQPVVQQQSFASVDFNGQAKCYNMQLSGRSALTATSSNSATASVGGVVNSGEGSWPVIVTGCL